MRIEDLDNLVSWIQAMRILCLWRKEASSLKEDMRPLVLNCRMEEERLEEEGLGVGGGGGGVGGGVGEGGGEGGGGGGGREVGGGKVGGGEGGWIGGGEVGGGGGEHVGHFQVGEYADVDGRFEQGRWVHFLQELQRKEPDLRIGLKQTEQGNNLRLGGPGLGWMSPQLRRKAGM